MTASEIIQKVKSLRLPIDSYVVFGSGPMTIAGIRDANDIDLYVSNKLLEQLKKRGWKKQVKGPDDEPLVYDVFEAHDNWDFSKYSPTLEHLQTTATYVDDIPFASIVEVRKWKAASTRKKFKADVQLIDAYLKI